MLALLFALLLAPIGATRANPICAADQSMRIQIGAQSFDVSLAASEQERERGLSGRAALKPGNGMWFVFPEPGRHGFWMRDMNFPIDLVWVSPARQVLGAISLQPCGHDTCPIHMAPAPVGYVLEINAGEFAGKAGDEVVWRCAH